MKLHLKEKAKEALKKLTAVCGIEVGDTVKVTRKACEGEYGWDEVWVENMDKFIGNTYKVSYVSHGSDGFGLEDSGTDNSFVFPFFVLELIEKEGEEKESEIRESLVIVEQLMDNLDFDCQHENIEALMVELVEFIINHKGKLSGAFSFDTSIFEEYQQQVDILLEKLLKFCFLGSM